MTDKELFEDAAKAAGHLHLIPYKEEWLRSFHAWNPLLDSGDALRLAVELGIPIDFCHHSGISTATNPVTGLGCNEPREPDPYAATRRAIVRAAAEIGKAK